MTLWNIKLHIENLFYFCICFNYEKMDNDSINSLVYSREVVEFITVAKEFCDLTENVRNLSLQENLEKLQLLLPLLYVKAVTLPGTEKMLDEELEKFVTEMEYNVLLQRWMEVLGEHDSYYEVFDPDIQFGEEITTASISENLLDIYQDLKDFLTSYSIGDESVMNDSLYECVYHFGEFWGQRLVNVLRAVHMLLTGNVDLDNNNTAPGNSGVQSEGGRPGWFQKFFDSGHEK